MDKIELENNIKEVIELYNNLQNNLHNLLDWVKDDCGQRVLLDDFLDYIWLEKNEETRYAAYARITNLNERPLTLYLEQNPPLSPPYEWDELFQEKVRILDLAYKFVCDFHSEMQAVIITVIEEKWLLTPFYLEIFKWVANVWLAFNELFIPWKNHIVNWINRELEKKFDNDSNDIMDYLNKNNLFDLGHNGELADRSYTALVYEDWKYISTSYREVFINEVQEIVSEIELFVENLAKLEDEVYYSKNDYINYLNSIKEALLETNTNELVNKWSNVDEYWMQIKTPFQIGHPLEYYEDEYRKAVAPEWDLRLQNTVYESDIQASILNMFETFCLEFDKDNYKSIFEFSRSNLNRVQFYLSSPVLYYSSKMTWLFSAQVVPNDEVVSKMYGKKIFAFPEMVLKNKRNSPYMEIDNIIFDENLLEKYRELLHWNEEVFYKIYDILTIGHEYWHNLWLDTDTQNIMNKKTWVFKKIEEFKATTGWLVTFFYNENLAPDLKESLLVEHIYRCVSLIKYKEVNEVEPYYCEALIHLDILFESWIIFVNSDEKIEFKFNDETYEKLKEVYIRHYKKLINIYINKIDAGEFLKTYTIKEQWYYLPLNSIVRHFVEYYYDTYKDIWNEIEV